MLYDYLEIDFLDVGQGDGTLIVCPGGETILVDLGSKKNSDVAGTDAIKFLHKKLTQIKNDRELSQPTLDYLFITHPDGDHYNLLSRLLYEFFWPMLDIKCVVIGGVGANYRGIKSDVIEPAKLYGDLRTFGEEKHDPVDEPFCTLSDGNVTIHILCANIWGPNAKDSNSKSIVLRIEYAGRKVILTGDAEEASEKLIMGWYEKNPGFLKSDALKLGHHGSKNGTSEAWIEAVQPCMAFVSSDMKWAHPYCETIKRAADSGCLWALEQHLWLCGAGHGKGKEYFNHLSTCGIYTNLAYQVQREQDMTLAKEKIVNKEIEKLKTSKKVDSTLLPNGLVMGTQYELYIYEPKKDQILGDMQVICNVMFDEKSDIKVDFDTGRIDDGTPSKCLNDYWPETKQADPVAVNSSQGCDCC